MRVLAVCVLSGQHVVYPAVSREHASGVRVSVYNRSPVSGTRIVVDDHEQPAHPRLSAKVYSCCHTRSFSCELISGPQQNAYSKQFHFDMTLALVKEGEESFEIASCYLDPHRPDS